MKSKILFAVLVAVGTYFAVKSYAEFKLDVDVSGSATPEVIAIEGFCDVQENYKPCNDFLTCYGDKCIINFYREHEKMQVSKCLTAGGGQACTEKDFRL